MKSLIVLFTLASFGLSVPASEVATGSSSSDILPYGKYHFSYEGSDGLKASVSYVVTGESLQASVQYVGRDGVGHSISYTDATGWHVDGPQDPQIPPVVARALEWAQSSAHSKNSG